MIAAQLDTSKQQLFEQMYEKCGTEEPMTYEEMLEEPDFTLWMFHNTVKNVKENDYKDGMEYRIPGSKECLMAFPEGFYLVYDNGTKKELNKDDAEGYVLARYFANGGLARVGVAAQMLGVRKIYNANRFSLTVFPGKKHPEFRLIKKKGDE